MADLHACPLCGFAREAEHRTVLDPACPRCGGILEPARREAAEPGDRLRRLFESPLVGTALVALMVLPLLLGAAKLGWTAGGPALAAVALVVAALAAYVAVTPATRHR